MKTNNFRRETARARIKHEAESHMVRIIRGTFTDTAGNHGTNLQRQKTTQANGFRARDASSYIMSLGPGLPAETETQQI